MLPTETARKEKLLENFSNITQRIKSACEAASKNPAEVELLAVTKYAAVEDTRLLVEAGKIKFAGESRVQDAESKWVNGPLSGLRPAVELHFIGHLQTNKAAMAVEIFDSVDCVDSLKLALELNKHAAKTGRRLSVLLQLKLTNSPSQHGIPPEDAPGLLAEIKKLSNLSPEGYMAIAPLAREPETLKPLFASVKKIFDRDFPERANKDGRRNRLSLGMSGDFEQAVAEGATLPRLGSMLFA
ncbi:MAG: YggS family pyridoxal phosphate enzyme [Elusimicrobia bacterium GWF2_52_66]|nr:MAG: YggS family pyridoxal phosphate enzyme [Elusimicrobia bacterium GWA2_51_34]OGR86597.1 MAG: YggS family pyridoxal phosphate enzyme [Elusimicrobia bacterium GWF2_52_66]HAF95567.1 YggS family pyridoxal phosphate-dependent enzyme [Elusimicrobiota bacterium]HCE97689.1 YggS family pyridoxal phosphate-dependent enzyme [Elusimicrobiota bacterium]